MRTSLAGGTYLAGTNSMQKLNAHFTTLKPKLQKFKLF